MFLEVFVDFLEKVPGDNTFKYHIFMRGVKYHKVLKIPHFYVKMLNFTLEVIIVLVYLFPNPL